MCVSIAPKVRVALFLCATAILSSCGGGGGDGSSQVAGQGITAGSSPPAPPPPPGPSADKPATRVDAARFLNQATFGATGADIDRVMSVGYAAWIDEQFAMPRGRTFRNWYLEDGANSNSAEYFDPNSDRESAAWFTRVTREPDQLRLRMAWALSQIFVVNGGTLMGGTAQPVWMDLTADNAFGTYRNMLEKVTFSPVMGNMLSYLWNQDGNGAIPDQNYAREIMQLFSIGLWQLNQDGTPKLDSAGNRIPTYSQADVVGLSSVFTGLALATGGDRKGTCIGYNGKPAQGEPDYIACELSVWPWTSTKAKSFLGVSIAALDVSKLPANSEGTIQAQGRKNIGIALDTLASHSNTPPFIARNLIQRFTTSNPSPAYIRRVADKFVDNGNGVRGDFKAVLKQILLDPEARDSAQQDKTIYGKLREPLLAQVHYSRVLRASDGKGNVWAGSGGCKIYHGVISELERPYAAPSVFNYYRPGFSPASGEAAKRNLVVPEMQITDTVAVMDWATYVKQTLDRGGTGCSGGARRQNSFDYSELLPFADNATLLADEVLLRFAAGSDTSALRSSLIRAIQSVSGTTSTDRINRIKIAVMLTLLSPEYRVQR